MELPMMCLMAVCCILFGISAWALAPSAWMIAPILGMVICSAVGQAETTDYFRKRRAERKPTTHT